MELKEYAKYQSYCNKLGIVIYPIPYSTQHYKIAVATPTNEKIGEKVFKKFPDAKEENWSNAIREAYKIIYNKKHNIN
jgi:hypothetical protein